MSKQRSAGLGGADYRVHATLVLVQVAFGSLAVEGKIAMSPQVGVSAAALAMARIAGGLAALLLLGLGGGLVLVRSAKDVAKLAVLALLGVVLNQALFLEGLRRTSPLSATLLVATIPVFAAIASAALGRERLSLRVAAGMALAVLGIVVLTGFALPSLGDSFVLLNAVSYALYLALAPPLLARYGSRTVMVYVFALGSLLFAPFGGGALATDIPSWSARAWALVAFIIVVPTAFAYQANAWALRRATPTLVAVYIYLQPLVVAALAWVQLGQTPHLLVLAGGALILAGVTLVNTRSRGAAPSASGEPS